MLLSLPNCLLCHMFELFIGNFCIMMLNFLHFGNKRNTCLIFSRLTSRHQYSKTKEMHFLYSVYYELAAYTCFQHYLLIFRRRRTNSDFILRVCYICWLLPGFNSNPGSNQQTYHARNIPIVFCAAPPGDEQVVLEICRGC
jgi:hypothetical protein